MSAREFREWIAYSIVRPFGEDAEDVRSYEQIRRGGFGGGSDLKPWQLFDWIEEPKQTPEQVALQLKGIFGGNRNR